MSQADNTGTATVKVEFYPSVDDYVYISTRIGEIAGFSRPVSIVYNIFLCVNAILFPTFLFYHSYIKVGFAVFIVNLVAIIYLIPQLNSGYLRRFYAGSFGDRSKHLTSVELTSRGVYYANDGAEAFFPWRLITHIEETDQAFFFFEVGNAFAARKIGFRDSNHEREFVAFAESCLREQKLSSLAL